MKFLVWSLLGAYAVVMALLVLTGCATRVPADLDKLQRDVQNCILSGGHPHVGPDNSVLCTRQGDS